MKGDLGLSAANFLHEQPDDIRAKLVQSIEGETQLADLRKLAAELKGRKPQPIVSIGMGRADREALAETAEKEEKSISEFCYELLSKAPDSPLSNS